MNTAQKLMIGLIVIASIFIAYVSWSQASQQEMIDKGCDPEAFGGPSGLVTIWDCPSDVSDNE